MSNLKKIVTAVSEIALSHFLFFDFRQNLEISSIHLHKKLKLLISFLTTNKLFISELLKLVSLHLVQYKHLKFTFESFRLLTVMYRNFFAFVCTKVLYVSFYSKL